jgi:hypothetical protein
LGTLLPLARLRTELNDTGDLWAEARRRVEPESLVIGAIPAPFSTPTLTNSKRVGKRQCNAAGKLAFPVLSDLINDTLSGAVICGVVRDCFAPPGSPPMNRSEKSVRRSPPDMPNARVTILGFISKWFAVYTERPDARRAS